MGPIVAMFVLLFSAAMAAGAFLFAVWRMLNLGKYSILLLFAAVTAACISVACLAAASRIPVMP